MAQRETISSGIKIILKSVKIHIKGIVQGVGFRPFVHKIAIENNLNGWVINDSEGLRIAFEGTESSIDFALETLKNNSPQQARITSFTISQCELEGFEEFKIKKSKSYSVKSVLLTPDFSICPECEAEITDKYNRRNNYGFTTCTKCGPRYSIIDTMPYDRENTSMMAFQMCDQCEKEYKDFENRRYYSQTNSCSKCGVKLFYYSENEILNQNEENLIERSIEDLKKGKIIAVKGIGGFLLLCDAENSVSIKRLRDRKNRPTKPFALLYPNFESLQDDVEYNAQAIAELNSTAAPIILFKLKKKINSGIKPNLIAPGLNQIGVMKAYAPLILLLSKKFGKPLIATSANLSGSSIVYQNSDALENLPNIADSILYHDRNILIPEDDSVIRFSADHNKKVILRRSRGLAPNYFGSLPGTDYQILATGASLKSSFSIYKGQNVYVSQYLGDLDSFESRCNYKKCLNHFQNLLDFKADIVLSDKHPLYASTQIAKQVSSQSFSHLVNIQHHEAHFAAVLAENNLLNSSEKVLGVIWDGTGYGNDGNIWGGDFFTFENNKIERLDHFNYYPHILGDKMSREPRISALSILRNCPEKLELKKYFKKTEWILYNEILSKEVKIQNCSIGRVFDALACILGLGEKMNYEGEAAMYLEQLASSSQINETEGIPGDWINPEILLKTIYKEISEGISKADIAYNFHRKLVYTIKKIADRNCINKIAFSGGVFQNTLLIDLLLHSKRANEKLYFHRELSPNDENISFGQLAHYMISENRLKKEGNIIEELKIK